MSAREEILARVRVALADGATSPEVSRTYRRGGRLEADAVLDLFAARVADYRATVLRCAPAEVAQTVVEALAGAATVVVPRGIPWEVEGAVVDDGLSAAELDEFDAVVTAAAVGIAVTGTVVLDHGPGQGRRVLSLVPDRHVCVVRADQVVETVPEAVARLDPVRPQTWISGPSATSDIELARVEGVHGPRQLTVVLVEERVRTG